MIKYIGYFSASTVGLLAFLWLVQGNDFLIYRYFAPKQEAVRRQTFEQSKAYNEGIAQELAQAQLDFAKAKDDNQRKAIASFALHQVGGYDTSLLPADLQLFVSQLRAEVAR